MHFQSPHTLTFSAQDCSSAYQQASAYSWSLLPLRCACTGFSGHSPLVSDLPTSLPSADNFFLMLVFKRNFNWPVVDCGAKPLLKGHQLVYEMVSLGSGAGPIYSSLEARGAKWP